MIILISPSKTLSKRSAPSGSYTLPTRIDKAQTLVETLNKNPKKLAQILGVSENIAALNRERFEAWNVDAHRSGKPAIYAYAGDVYNGVAAFDMSKAEIAYAQKHLRMLSGLYGALRPLDKILPYRLEMSTRLMGSWGSNLYAFWDNIIAQDILAEEPGLILNCASTEYEKAVLPYLPDEVEVISPVFLHDSGSGPKAKMTFAKYARGLMARWAIENKINSAEAVTTFDSEGYTYNPGLSKPGAPAFLAPRDYSLKGRFTRF